MGHRELLLFPLVEKLAIITILRQLHRISMVDLKRRLIPGTEGDNNPSDLTDVNPDCSSA